MSAAVCAGAILDRAPPGALPLVIAVCVGCPIFAGWQAPVALASMGAERALARLRGNPARLPETEHPLGL